VPTAANRQPAARHYLRRAGTTVFRAHVLDVLRVEGRQDHPDHGVRAAPVPAFGLPSKIAALPLP
jgi:RNA polymerase sigma-70 factor (ECF subfamily)